MQSYKSESKTTDNPQNPCILFYTAMYRSNFRQLGFEDFDLDTVILPDSMWIPAGKTNQLRALSVFDARSAQLSLLVTGGFKLKERGISFWDALEKYWTGIPDFSFPVNVNEGSALFKANGVTKVVPFNATFP